MIAELDELVFEPIRKVIGALLRLECEAPAKYRDALMSAATMPKLDAATAKKIADLAGTAKRKLSDVEADLQAARTLAALLQQLDVDAPLIEQKESRSEATAKHAKVAAAERKALERRHEQEKEELRSTLKNDSDASVKRRNLAARQKEQLSVLDAQHERIAADLMDQKTECSKAVGRRQARLDEIAAILKRRPFLSTPALSAVVRGTATPDDVGQQLPEALMLNAGAQPPDAAAMAKQAEKNRKRHEEQAAADLKRARESVRRTGESGMFSLTA